MPLWVLWVLKVPMWGGKVAECEPFGRLSAALLSMRARLLELEQFFGMMGSLHVSQSQLSEPNGTVVYSRRH